MYLSDVASGIIMRTSLNGSSPEILLTLQFEYIGELYKLTIHKSSMCCTVGAVCTTIEYSIIASILFSSKLSRQNRSANTYSYVLNLLMYLPQRTLQWTGWQTISTGLTVCRDEFKSLILIHVARLYFCQLALTLHPEQSLSTQAQGMANCLIGTVYIMICIYCVATVYTLIGMNRNRLNCIA